MESTFTFQPSYPDSETSWRDNANWKEAPREHSNPELTLPHRNVKKRFEHVPDFGDAEFDKKNPEHYIKARDQRYREHFISIEEMSMLQEEIRQCYLLNRASVYRVCRPLILEYKKRIFCPGYSCKEDRKVFTSPDDFSYAKQNSEVAPRISHQKLNMDASYPKE